MYVWGEEEDSVLVYITALLLLVDSSERHATNSN